MEEPEACAAGAMATLRTIADAVIISETTARDPRLAYLRAAALARLSAARGLRASPQRGAPTA